MVGSGAGWLGQPEQQSKASAAHTAQQRASLKWLVINPVSTTPASQPTHLFRNVRRVANGRQQRLHNLRTGRPTVGRRGWVQAPQVACERHRLQFNPRQQPHSSRQRQPHLRQVAGAQQRWRSVLAMHKLKDAAWKSQGLRVGCWVRGSG